MNKLVIDNEKYKGLMISICRDIAASGWTPDYIVGLTRGGLSPAVLISQWFGIRCETLKVSLRDENGESESNLWMAEDAYGYVDASSVPRPEDEVTTDPSLRKNILIVDDINDSGATINFILEDWASGCMPHDPAWNDIWNNNVRFATVVDNLASKANVKMDYVGMEINKSENDVWVEFPWENWWTK